MAMPNGYIPPGSLHHGASLRFTGTPTDYSGFTINLKTSSGDIALHFNVRFNEGRIVLNSMTSGSWGSEHTLSLGSLGMGRPADVMILAEHERFMIAVNGQHMGEFRHRVSKDSITNYEVVSMMLTSVQLPHQHGHHHTPPPPPQPHHHGGGFNVGFNIGGLHIGGHVGGGPIHAGAGSTVSIANPHVPFTHHLMGGVHDKRIIVNGIFQGSFSVNLQVGHAQNHNVALHVNPRHHDRAIIYNSCRHGNWEREERSHSFHFTHGAPFTMEIHCGHHGFKVKINGHDNHHFHNRGRPLHEIDTLFIDGQVHLTNVAVQLC